MRPLGSVFTNMSLAVPMGIGELLHKNNTWLPFYTFLIYWNPSKKGVPNGTSSQSRSPVQSYNDRI
jgi:hypothetical protein